MEKNKNEQQTTVKDVFKTIKEVNERERHEAIEQEAKRQQDISRKKEKEHEKYEKELMQEKIELIKEKQGLVEISETEISDEPHKKYTVKEKISNFIYHSKWILALSLCFGAIGIFLIYDLVTRDNPDMTIMVLINDDQISHNRELIAEKFEQYIDDVNGNGETHVSVYYMPVSEDVSPYDLQANSTKLYALMQSGDTMLIMAEDKVYEQLLPDKTLDDISVYYSQDSRVEGYAYHFSDTDFMKDISYEGSAPKDYYIGVRKVRKGTRYTETMQKNYDIAFDALKQFIEEYSG